MLEYRPVPEADEDAYRRVLDYAFRAEEGPEPDHEDDPPFLGDRRALYDGDEPVTTAVRLPLTVKVRGAWRDVVGLSAVATLPEHRREGQVGRLLAASLAESRDAGLPFSLLWPFDHPFYRRFGWGRLCDLGQYELAPEVLEPVEDHPLAGGSFRRVEPDAFAELQAVDERFADRFDAAMRRTEDWYRHRFFDGWRGDPFVYGWVAGGELRGYLRYQVAREDERVFRVTDFGAPDPAAAVNLYRFLFRHVGQADAVELYAPVDDALFDLVEDPREVELMVRPGPMGRIVDVAASIEALPAPEPAAEPVTIAVEDGHCDWNDGTFGVEVTDDGFSVTEGGGDGPTATMPVETLSRLAVGSMAAERAAFAGGLEADDDAIDRLDALFPPRECYLREFF